MHLTKGTALQAHGLNTFSRSRTTRMCVMIVKRDVPAWGFNQLMSLLLYPHILDPTYCRDAKDIGQKQ